MDDSGDDLFASVDDSSDVTPKKSAALFQSNVEEDTGPLSKKPSQAEVSTFYTCIVFVYNVGVLLACS